MPPHPLKATSINIAASPDACTEFCIYLRHELHCQSVLQAMHVMLWQMGITIAFHAMQGHGFQCTRVGKQASECDGANNEGPG